MAPHDARAQRRGHPRPGHAEGYRGGDRGSPEDRRADRLDRAAVRDEELGQSRQGDGRLSAAAAGGDRHPIRELARSSDLPAGLCASRDGEHFTDAGYRYVWQKIKRDSTFAAAVEPPKSTPVVQASAGPKPGNGATRPRYRKQRSYTAEGEGAQQELRAVRRRPRGTMGVSGQRANDVQPTPPGKQGLPLVGMTPKSRRKSCGCRFPAMEMPATGCFDLRNCPSENKPVDHPHADAYSKARQSDPVHGAVRPAVALDSGGRLRDARLGLYIGLSSAPPDYQQGETARIMFVHVPSAWLAMPANVGRAVGLRAARVPPSAGRRIGQGRRADRRRFHRSCAWSPARCGASRCGAPSGCGTRG